MVPAEVGGDLVDITHLTVEVRDAALNRIGMISLTDLSLTIEDQFRNVGSWTVVLPSEGELAAILRQPGSGIIVTLENGDVLMSGPMVKAEDSSTSTDPNGTLQVDGVTDTVLLADRLCFPNPGSLDPGNQPNTHDVRTGTCEDVMYGFVNVNLGPGAAVSSDPTLGSRRDARVQLGTNGHRGPTVTKRGRFDVLGNMLADLAATAGIGFRVVQVGNKLEFQTFDVADRASSIRLDIRNNMLAGSKVAIAPPSMTRAIVAGQDIEKEPTESATEWAFERQLISVSTTESRAGEALWGRRIETYVDRRQTDGSSELVQAGAEALQAGGFSQISVQVVPMEDFFSDFGVDWHLGDHITVVVQGEEMAADITGYVLKYDSNGFRMGVILGDPTALNRHPVTMVKALDSRVSNLERGGVTPESVTTVDAKTDNLDVRATTLEGGVTALDGRIDVLEAEQGERVQILNAAGYTQSSGVATYPEGDSGMWITATQATSQGWSFAGSFGTLHTYRDWGTADAQQVWQKGGGDTTISTLWVRTGNSGGWGSWKALLNTDEVNAIVSAAVNPVSARVTTLEATRTKTGTVSFAFTGASDTINVTFPQAFPSAPNVHCNINAGHAATSQWHSRAINVTATGFTVFVFGPSATWAGVPVQWTAIWQ